MIPVSEEPRGLKPDAKPVAAFAERGDYRAKAESGSERLRRAVARMASSKAREPKRRRFDQKKCDHSSKARLAARTEVQRVQSAAAAYFELHLSDLTGARGRKELAWRRQIAMYVARTSTAASYPDIGHCFGGRDHTTVLHACRLIENDAAARRHIAAIRRAIGK